MGGAGWFNDPTGTTTGGCDAKTLTVETAGGNITLERGEVDSGPINRSQFTWYCGEVRRQNLGSSTCPDDSNYVEIARNYTGSGFLVTCYER